MLFDCKWSGPSVGSSLKDCATSYFLGTGSVLTWKADCSK